MTSTASLASRTAGPPLLASTTPPGASPDAPPGPGRASTAARAGSAASPILAARTAGAAASGAAKAGAKATGAKAAAAKKPTAKKAPGTGSASKGGYAQGSLPADYAFLRDPKLSLDEKLSRFIGLAMAKAESDLLAQMEKMAPGATAGATAKGGSASGSGGTSSSAGAGATGGAGVAAPRKKKGFSLWSAVKVMLPAVGMAATVLGEAATKKLVQQLSGPVLAAAATALGMPQLAPIALQAGKALGAVATDDAKGAGAAVVALGGMAAGALTSTFDGAGMALGSAATSAAGGTSKPSGTSGTSKTSGASGASGNTSGGATSTGATTTRSEMADQLELQRLMERQKETFSILSNILRVNHEARMASIQNIR